MTASVTVTDSNYLSATASCSVNSGPGGNALTITTSSTLPYGAAGSAYSQTLTATGGTGSYTWSALSTLPTGLTLSSSGVLSGTPTTAGSYTFYINVADTGGHSVSSEFALTVASGGAQSSVQISLAYPQLSGGYPGGLHKFTFHFTDPLGPTDISGGQIAFNIDTTAPDLPVCQLDWYTNGKVDITGVAYGNFGGGELSSTYCNLYTGESSLTQTAQGYDVSVVVSFPEALPNPLMPAWTRGFPVKSGTGDFTPVGAHSLSPRVALGQVPGDGYCGGTVALNGYLNLYAAGTIVGAVGASTPDIGYAAGWQNSVGYGQIYSNSNVNNAIATNPNWSLVTIDSEESILLVPPGAPYPTVPGGVYYTQANYQFTNPNCTIILEYGAPGVSEGNTAIFPEYYIEFDLSGPPGDPTPYIDGISPSVINTGPNQVTITGGGFGTVQGSLAICYSGANPCTSSDVTYSVNSWGPNTIVATLNVPSTDNGNSYDIEVTSNGSLATGFQSTGTTQATSNTATLTVRTYTVTLAPCVADSLNPNQLDLSTGDTGVCASTTVSPSSLPVTPLFFSFAPMAGTNPNPNSYCMATLSSSNGSSGTGPISSVIQASPQGSGPPWAAACSGIFNAQAFAGPGGKPSNFIQIVVPPQALVSQLSAEAGTFSSNSSLDPQQVAQKSVGWTDINRFSYASNPNPALSGAFRGVTTFQALAAAQNPKQIAQDGTYYGPPILIDNAAEVFALQIPDPTGGSPCYWSPTDAETTTILNALQSGQTAFPSGLSDPRCFYLLTSPAGSSTQIVIKSSMPNNTVAGKQNSPAFAFERLRSPGAAAVVAIY
jgi:hypothetical protein